MFCQPCGLKSELSVKTVVRPPCFRKQTVCTFPLSCPGSHCSPENCFSKMTKGYFSSRVSKSQSPCLSFFKSVTQLQEGTKCTSVIFCSNNSPAGIINFSSGPEQISVAFNGTLFLDRTVTPLDLLFNLYEKLE